MCDVPPGADAQVATASDCRPRVQCADIILHDQPSRRAALRWVASAWIEYPGCVVAAARDRHGRWAVIATRDGGTLWLRATGGSTVDMMVAEAVARGRYVQWVVAHRRTGRARWAE